MFYSTKVGGGRSGGLHGYDLFAPKLPVLSSPQDFFSRSERCGEAQCVAFFRAPRLFPFSSFSHSNIVFVFYSTHYPTDAQINLPHPHKEGSEEAEGGKIGYSTQSKNSRF